MKFTHLHTHSHYSLLDGLAKINQLIGRAKELGMDSLAITDHGNLYGAIEFYKAAKKAGIKPIIGVEAYIMAPSTGSGQANGNGGGKDKYYHLVLLCKNEAGWKNLLKLITHAHLEGFYYKPRINKDYLRQHSDGLIALSACLSGEVNRALLNGRTEDAEKIAFDYQNIFGKENFYLEIGHHPGIKENEKIRRPIIELSKKTGIPLCATQDLHYLKKEDSEYHEILLAVQTGGKLDDPDRLSLKDDDFSMRSPEEMAELFKEIPEAIANTQKIAEQCNLEIELGKIRLPKFAVPSGETAESYLKKLVTEKTKKRYPELTSEVSERINYELGVVEKMGFADYFLIVQDFVNWAKERGVVVGPGRGSAAGSIVSYILGITNVDPIKYELLFERFLNPDRVQMPDIDIDITDRRRDEVVGYLSEKYGADHVAHIITFGTMAARAAIRDVGRALNISYGFCDQLAKLIPFNVSLEDAMKITEVASMYANNPDAKRILDGARKLEGVARHASTHACGIVISEKPLTDHLPLQKAPQDPNTIVTQFEMHSVEDLGLLKMDLLGLKNLTIIEDAVRLIQENRGVKIDIDNIPLDDKKTFELLQAGNTTGVFQFESSGMRRYMKEIQPTELEDLIALVALYRPGPMDLIPTYIRRKHGLEKPTYLHPKLENILKNTHGVGVYQEQMMSIARELAGFTLAEADTLRKAIGKKIKELLDKQQEKLIKGMLANGITQQTANAIWDLFPPFARYGFNRSHAVCYALIGYQTAYLKAHYPAELVTSLLNADAGDVDRIAFLVSESQKMNLSVLPPDINQSHANFTADINSNNIRFGLAAIKNVGANIVDAVIEERQKSGPYKNLADLLNRIQHRDLNKKSLESLTKCGAMDSLGFERNLILQNMEDIIKFYQALKRAKETSQMGLFKTNYTNNSLRIKKAPEASSKEKLAWEKELLGLYISDHPLNAHRLKIQSVGAKPIKEVMNEATRNKPRHLSNAAKEGGVPPAAGQQAASTSYRVGGLISQIKKIVTKTGQPMLFAKIEDFNDSMEVVVFPSILEQNSAIWQEGAPVIINGKMSWRNDEPKLICDKAELL